MAIWSPWFSSKDSCPAFAVCLKTFTEFPRDFDCSRCYTLLLSNTHQAALSTGSCCNSWSLLWLFADVEILSELSRAQRVPHDAVGPGSIALFCHWTPDLSCTLTCTSSISFSKLHFPNFSDIMLFSLLMVLPLNHHLHVFYNIAFN